MLSTLASLAGFLSWVRRLLAAAVAAVFDPYISFGGGFVCHTDQDIYLDDDFDICMQPVVQNQCVWLCAPFSIVVLHCRCGCGLKTTFCIAEITEVS